MNRFLEKLRYVKARDLASAFAMLAALPCAHVLKGKRPHIWLICEDREEARDNGYWLFKYLCREQPQVDAVYAIDMGSPDAQRVRGLGKQVIPWGGLRHWAYYLAAENNISSQKDGKPNAALCYLLEVYGLRENRRIFLQHGITHNDTDYLHYENTKMSMFVCGARREYEYVKEHFGYPEGAVRLLGLPRFDGLQKIANENFILVMPTWRRCIATPGRFSKRLDTPEAFRSTAYFKAWQRFFEGGELLGFLEREDLRLVFYPHRNMQRFLHLFKSDSPRVELADWRTHDVQDLLRRASFLITDYSSVAMDFAYMGKPLLYYQFDVEEFRKNQYAKGYFSFENDGFGPVCHDFNEVKEALFEAEKRGFANEDPYLHRGRAFFELHDARNCNRNYEAIRDFGQRRS